MSDQRGADETSLTDRAASAGSVTSRIDHQDAVAVLVGLRLLSGASVADVLLDAVAGSVIHAEGRDDLEVVTPAGRILISVKALSATIPLVASEYKRLRSRTADDADRPTHILLALVGPQTAEVVRLEGHLQKTRNLITKGAGGSISSLLPKLDAIAADFSR